MTESQQLDDLATQVESATAWSRSLITAIHPLVRQASLDLQQRDIGPLDNSVTDNIYRMRPRGWVQAEQGLGLNGGRGVASFALWTQGPGDAHLGGLGLKMEVGIQRDCATVALAMLSASARVWAYLLRQVGR